VSIVSVDGRNLVDVQSGTRQSASYYTLQDTHGTFNATVVTLDSDRVDLQITEPSNDGSRLLSVYAASRASDSSFTTVLSRPVLREVGLTQRIIEGTTGGTSSTEAQASDSLSAGGQTAFMLQDLGYCDLTTWRVYKSVGYAVGPAEVGNCNQTAEIWLRIWLQQWNAAAGVWDDTDFVDATHIGVYLYRNALRSCFAELSKIWQSVIVVYVYWISGGYDTAAPTTPWKSITCYV